MMKRVSLAAAWRPGATALALLLLLAGCATLPSGERKPARAPAQPLERIALPATPPEKDSLQILLSAQFALASGDLPTAAREFSRAARVSDDPALAAQATRVALAARQWDLARESLARWAALQGEDVDIWQARAILALHDGHADIALANLQRLTAEAEGKGWSAVAQALLNAEDHAAAGALLEKLARPEKLGDKVQTWIAMSQLAARLDCDELAQSLAEQALKRFNNADTYAWAAQLKLKDGDKAGARTLFADALRRNPHDAHLRIGYATLLGELGENAEAARTLAGGPQDDYTYAARAAYVARADDKALTEALYREVKALPEPRSPDRINLLGQLAELLEHKNEALAWYEKVPPDSEHAFSAQLRRAVLLDDLGRTAEAATLVHDLQARSGDDSKSLGETYLLEAEMLSRRHKGEEAIATYDRGLQALPDDTRLLYARALLNDELNHVDAAVRDLRRVLELKPEDASAMNALGYTLADRTDKQGEALDLIRKALTLKPDEPAIIDSMGWVQYRLGHLDAAIEQLRNAYGRQPDAEIAAHLGEVLWVAGQKDEARKVWEQGRKKDAKNKTLLETIQRLSS